jgi:hypothetical protein
MAQDQQGQNITEILSPKTRWAWWHMLDIK